MSHQIGQRTELRFRSLAGSIKKKIKASTIFQANLFDPEMQARHTEIRWERRSKVQEKTLLAKEKKANQTKIRKHDHYQGIIDLPELTCNIPSLLELTIIDQEEAAAAHDGDV